MSEPDDTVALNAAAVEAAATLPPPSDSLVYRDGTGAGRRFPLPDTQERVVVGRSARCALSLPWDDEVSRAHAELLCVGGRWLIRDDGMSRNGTFVNGVRLSGGHWLADSDRVLVGRSQLIFRRWLTKDEAQETTPGGKRVEITPAQHAVLRSLCRPLLNGVSAVPATNKEIAQELCVAEDTVKDHLKELFRRFRLEGSRPHQKRHQLAQRAQQQGLV